MYTKKTLILIGLAWMAVSANAQTANTSYGTGAGNSGTYNSFFGYQAGYSTTGNYNTGNGYNSLYNNNTGSFNAASGVQALYSNTTGQQNVALGHAAIYANVSGSYNVGIGEAVLAFSSAGSYNTALGYHSGTYIFDGSTPNSNPTNSIYIGANTFPLGANDNNEIVIGYNAVGLGANSVVLGNNSTAKTALFGSVVMKGTGSSIIFPDGTTQTTAFNATCGADYAESVDVTGDRTKYEPGDLLVIDPNAPGSFLKSNQPYSTFVAGVYSTKPGFVGRKQPANDPASAKEVPMAMVGRVPTKVSAENGPIKVGDLLVTSSTMGYAMKGTDRGQMLGAVIGKALGSLDSGTGVIEVLVTLQ